jgi:hypothetical protein
LIPDGLGNDRGDDGPERLTGTIGIKGAKDGKGETERKVITLYQLIGCNFAGCIRGLSLKRVSLINGSILRGSIDLARGGMDDSLQPFAIQTCIE